MCDSLFFNDLYVKCNPSQMDTVIFTNKNNGYKIFQPNKSALCNSDLDVVIMYNNDFTEIEKVRFLKLIEQYCDKKITNNKFNIVCDSKNKICIKLNIDDKL